MVSDEHVARAGGLAAIAGVLLLVGATMMHPMHADPNDNVAAFAEYAADELWVATHLAQFAGALLLTAGFLAFSWRQRMSRAGPWAFLAGATAVVAVAATAALQAVDGVALKLMVDRWSAASAETRPLVFEATLAVRHIEIGLASIACALFGVTLILYGVTVMLHEKPRKWFAIAGMVAGCATTASAVGVAHAGFSSDAMTWNMWSTLLALLWCLCMGALLLRAAGNVQD